MIRDLTYSSLKTYRNCRRKYYLRNVKELVSVGRVDNLFFGQVIHDGLAAWHGRSDGAPFVHTAIAMAERAFPGTENLKNRFMAIGMLIGYAKKYFEDDPRPVVTEGSFVMPIINPATGRASRSFQMRGKVDMLALKDGELFLVEHKTAAEINGAYLEALPLDFQINLYSHYLSQFLGVPIAGVIYNILVKTKIRQKKSETDDEFQLRMRKTYDNPEMFHRELLYLSERDAAETVAEVWELTQQLLESYRNGSWYRNTDWCFGKFNQPCSYFPLCRANGDELVQDNLYEHKEAHSELQAEQPAF